MGISFGKKKGPPSRITEQDKAILVNFLVKHLYLISRFILSAIETNER